MTWTTWTTRLIAALMVAALSGCVTGYGYHTAGIDVGTADYYYDDRPASAPVYVLPPSGVLGYNSAGGWYGSVGLGFGSGYGLGGYYSPWGTFGPRGHLNLRHGYGGYWRPPYVYRPPYHPLHPVRPYPPRHHAIVTRPPKGHTRRPHGGNRQHWNRPEQIAPGRHPQDRRLSRHGSERAMVNSYRPETDRPLRTLRPERVVTRPGPGPSLSPPTRHAPAPGRRSSPMPRPPAATETSRDMAVQMRPGMSPQRVRATAFPPRQLAPDRRSGAERARLTTAAANRPQPHAARRPIPASPVTRSSPAAMPPRAAPAPRAAPTPVRHSPPATRAQPRQTTHRPYQRQQR